MNLNYIQIFNFKLSNFQSILFLSLSLSFSISYISIYILLSLLPTSYVVMPNTKNCGLDVMICSHIILTKYKLKCNRIINIGQTVAHRNRHDLITVRTYGQKGLCRRREIQFSSAGKPFDNSTYHCLVSISVSCL